MRPTVVHRSGAGRHGRCPRQHTADVTVPATPSTDVRELPASGASTQVTAWARAVEVGVLARAAREDPSVPWRGSATEVELRALEEAGVRARQAFVAANVGLVGSVVAGYARSGPLVADLFQEGCLGLIMAVQRFDHRRGVRFSTYATFWIRAAVGSAASRFAGAVSIPVSRNDQLRVARGVEGSLAQQLGRQPTVAEVAAALGRDERWTAGLLGQRSVRSLEEVDDRQLHRLSATASEPDDAGEREPELWARRLLGTLEGFERSVLELRLGFDGRPPRSLAGAARELGVPVGRVRRAESRALEELRGRCPRAVLAALAS